MKLTFKGSYSYTCPTCKKEITCFDTSQINKPCSNCDPKQFALNCPKCGATGGIYKNTVWLKSEKAYVYCNVCETSFNIMEILDFNQIKYTVKKNKKGAK